MISLTVSIRKCTDTMTVFYKTSLIQLKLAKRNLIKLTIIGWPNQVSCPMGGFSEPQDILGIADEFLKVTKFSLNIFIWIAIAIAKIFGENGLAYCWSRKEILLMTLTPVCRHIAGLFHSIRGHSSIVKTDSSENADSSSSSAHCIFWLHTSRKNPDKVQITKITL